MPAKSRKMQKFMGMVHRCQKTGDCASPEVEKVAKSISYKDAEDFASTKHKGLPEKVEENDVFVCRYRTTPEMWDKIRRHGLDGPNTMTGDEFKAHYTRMLGESVSFKDWFYQNEN